MVILARIETSPEDIKGMDASEGILTARGGMTSHAALVARQMGKVCVAGAGELNIDYKKREIEVDGKIVKEGDWISLDGSTGEVIQGKIDTKPSDVLQVLVDHSLRPEESGTGRAHPSSPWSGGSPPQRRTRRGGTGSWRPRPRARRRTARRRGTGTASP